MAKPGERVDLIRQLAEALGHTSFAHVDLVLRQFGFPWSGQWDGGDVEFYAQYHLEKGKDEQLLALDEYLFPSEATGSRSPTGRWSPGRFRLFMSHVHADKLVVSAVKTALSLYVIDCFVAHEDIEPTKEWITRSKPPSIPVMRRRRF